MAWFRQQRRLWAVALLGLAGLQLWTAYMARAAHPYLALTNVLMAAILILGVLFTW